MHCWPFDAGEWPTMGVTDRVGSSLSVQHHSRILFSWPYRDGRRLNTKGTKHGVCILVVWLFTCECMRVVDDMCGLPTMSLKATQIECQRKCRKVKKTTLSPRRPQLGFEPTITRLQVPAPYGTSRWLRCRCAITCHTYPGSLI